MTAANENTPAIGPATDARIMNAFADKCLLTCDATAGLLGIDVKSLRALTEQGLIRAVRRGAGSVRAYTEGDIRAYLTESAAPCPSTSRQPVVTGSTTSNSRVVGFTARRALKQSALPNR